MKLRQLCLKLLKVDQIATKQHQRAVCKLFSIIQLTRHSQYPSMFLFATFIAIFIKQKRDSSFKK